MRLTLGGRHGGQDFTAVRVAMFPLAAFECGDWPHPPLTQSARPVATQALAVDALARRDHHLADVAAVVAHRLIEAECAGGVDVHVLAYFRYESAVAGQVEDEPYPFQRAREILDRPHVAVVELDVV